MVKVAFFKTSSKYASWIDKLIALWTRGKYSHVEIILGNYQYSSFMGVGVRKKFHNLDKETWDYIDIKEVVNYKIQKFYEETKGKKYDWFGVFGFVIPFIKQKKKRYFCSEWVAEALIKGGCESLKEYKTYSISPNKLYNILSSKSAT